MLKKTTSEKQQGQTATGQAARRPAAIRQTVRRQVVIEQTERQSTRGQTAIEYLFIIAATVTFVTVVTYFVKTNVVK